MVSLEWIGIASWNTCRPEFNICFGNPEEEIPGKNIIFPMHPSFIKARDENLDKLRRSLILKAVDNMTPTETDIVFLAEETKSSADYVYKILQGR